MSFRMNDSQQMSFDDSVYQLTAREQKALQNSWAKVFAEEIFPKIDERPFSVLYSDKASRPNTPVNVIIGASIIKELFDYSDDEMVENLMLDIRMQYALHTTSFTEQPLSDKTLSRFRRRCYDYETLYGVDLYRNAILDYSNEIAKMMKLDGKIRRMDSMMINSNMRIFARSELIYTCISKLVKYLSDNHPEMIPDGLKHYALANDFNTVMHHERSSTIEERLQVLFEDSKTLYSICKDNFEGVTEYELFFRCFSEQTIIDNGQLRLFTKGDKKGFSKMLLNPSDPEATFRRKAGKEYQGYVANIEETVGANGSVVTDYRYEQNIYADQTFLKDRIEELSVQKEPATMITDGAYYSQEAADKAREKNIALVPTALTAKIHHQMLDKFELNEEKTRVIKCPAGHEPKSCCYKKNNDEFKITFDRDLCVNCPYRDQCRPKIFKKISRLLITRNSFLKLELYKLMQSKEFKNYTCLRNGIETVPSNLRRNYRLDKLPRGKQRGKFFFGCKIAALNFKKLFNHLKGSTNYALNPLLI